ncbi:hypothetical protein K438DRAFT_1832929 [Mycena galopus ATCC 62051]|nr:hypothetical protein K438DRAFT_1832929 [Mycena galopus ATCC 62051]
MELPTNTATKSSSHLFQNAADFEIRGGQYVLGDVHNHHTTPGLPASTLLLSNILDEAFSESEVYCSQMLRRKRGFPLYEPAPEINLPAAYQKYGVSIGDVGSVTPEGIFDFFFNIFLPAEHIINGNRTPEDFSPMSPYESVDLSNLLFPPGNYVSTPSVQRLDLDTTSEEFPGGDFVFSCDGTQGAVLALPYGAHVQKLRNVETIRTYAADHAASWYKYINGPRGRGLANGELYLVTGWEKARSWGMASYYGNNTEFGIAFKPAVRGGAHQYRWSGTGTKNPSQKKSYDRPQANYQPLNHTTFIHGLSISIGTGLWSRLSGTVGVETSSLADFQSRSSATGGSHVGGSQGSSFLWSRIFLGGGGAAGRKHVAGQHDEIVLSDVSPHSGKVCNPGKLINEYILHKTPNATVVISHDDDWSDILGDLEIEGSSEFLQRIDHRFSIAEQDSAMFLVSKSPRSTTSPTDTASVLLQDVTGPSTSHGRIQPDHLIDFPVKAERLGPEGHILTGDAIFSVFSFGPRFPMASADRRGDSDDQIDFDEGKEDVQSQSDPSQYRVPSSSHRVAAVTPEAPVKRGRGRPKGSKNKRAAPGAAEASLAPPRKRGRPPKEKKDDDDKDMEDDGDADGDDEPPIKRKRGRPPKTRSPS